MVSAINRNSCPPSSESAVIGSPNGGQPLCTAHNIACFQRKRPAHKPFPDHLPRERVVIPAPESRSCCGSKMLSKLGEDITKPWRSCLAGNVRERLFLLRLRALFEQDAFWLRSKVAGSGAIASSPSFKATQLSVIQPRASEQVLVTPLNRCANSGYLIYFSASCYSTQRV